VYLEVLKELTDRSFYKKRRLYKKLEFFDSRGLLYKPKRRAGTPTKEKEVSHQKVSGGEGCHKRE